jgi:hypothetical protein
MKCIKQVMQLAASMLLVGCVQATSIPESPIAISMGQRCPGIVLKWMGQPEALKLLRNNPIDVVGVCGCAQRKLAEDKFIQKYLYSMESIKGEKFNKPNLMAYVTIRSNEAAMSCLLPMLQSGIATVVDDDFELIQQ